ncbi:MAG: Ig-like domain-containing protein [Caldilineaceae bacterium]
MNRLASVFDIMRRSVWSHNQLYAVGSLILLYLFLPILWDVSLSQLGPAVVNSSTASTWRIVDSVQAAPVEQLKAITAGRNHTCALTVNGGVKCWGVNFYGQLGDGTTVDHLIPQDVNGLTSGVSAISAGQFHTCALMTSGGIRCWGRNAYGQLGDGTLTDRLTPVDVLGLAGGVKAVTAGSFHSCALTNSDGIKCWGSNFDGELGDGTTLQRLTPVDVSGLTSGVDKVVAGNFHTCAVTVAGGLQCWGNNLAGQLGDGTQLSRLTPTAVNGLNSSIASVVISNADSSTASYTCAITTVGSVKCWGDNRFGQLGDGTVLAHLTPVAVNGLSGAVSAIAAGEGHTCALITNGSVQCWGDNAFGELGDGTKLNHLTPIVVSGLATSISGLALGRQHTCAVTTTNRMQCWGNNQNGELGNGFRSSLSSPSLVSSLGATVRRIAGGREHSCAVTNTGNIACWGNNNKGQLGDGSQTSHFAPTIISGLANISSVTTGFDYSCAVTTSGAVKCWGNNAQGELGDGTTIDKASPVNVVNLSSNVSTVVAGDGHTCALLGDGSVKCWGNNFFGQLGTNDLQGNWPTPRALVSLRGVVNIAAGNAHTCAVLTGGSLKCWGRNWKGQVGDGTTTDQFMPTNVTGLNSGVSAVALGEDHTCALLLNGSVKCWGNNDEGQLGDGTQTLRLTPVDVTGVSSGVLAISAGQDHTCALLASGSVMCWGRNWEGQLGLGRLSANSPIPVTVPNLSNAVTLLDAGHQHTCVIENESGAKCWGSNSEGQLGNGKAGYAIIPEYVDDGITSPTPHAPIADNQAVTTSEDTPLNLTLTGSDADGDALTFTLLTQPQHGLLAGAPPNLNYTPAANYYGVDSFTFKANDGRADSNIATVSLTVTPINDAPDTTITTQPANPSTSSDATFGFTGNDVEGNVLTFACALDSAPFTSCVTPVTYHNLSNALHTFQVRATDSQSATDPTPALYAWTVNVTQPSDLIFADGFEAGNLTAWSTSVTDGGNLSVSSAAALVGSRGLQALINDNNPLFLSDETPNAEPHYRARFVFDPNTITMKSGDAHYLFYGYQGATKVILRIEFRFYKGAYQLRAALLNDSTTWKTSSWLPITDAPHTLELDWRASASPTAKNGALTFWIDNVQKANLTGIDNDTRRIDRVQLGAIAGIDTGTRGSDYFDAFESRRQSYIGPTIFAALTQSFAPNTEMDASSLTVTPLTTTVQQATDEAVLLSDTDYFAIRVRRPIQTARPAIIADLQPFNATELPDGYTMLGDSFKLTRTASAGLGLAQLAQPFTLTLSFHDLPVDANLATLSLQQWNVATEQWEVMPAQINPTEQTLTILLTAPGSFAIFQPETSGSYHLYLPAISQ